MYGKNNTARQTLIQYALKVHYNYVYDDNPYEKNKNTIKKTVRHLPIGYSNTELLNYLLSRKKSWTWYTVDND